MAPSLVVDGPSLDSTIPITCVYFVAITSSPSNLVNLMEVPPLATSILAVGLSLDFFILITSVSMVVPPMAPFQVVATLS